MVILVQFRVTRVKLMDGAWIPDIPLKVESVTVSDALDSVCERKVKQGHFRYEIL